MKRIILSALIMLFACAYSYDFTYNNRSLKYDEDTLKFYENDKLLDKDEVKAIFPDYEVILISQFNNDKKIKIKNKFFKTKKILLLNDTNRTFHLFFIYPETARFNDEKIKSLITARGKKNVRLKHSGGDEFEIVIR